MGGNFPKMLYVPMDARCHPHVAMGGNGWQWVAPVFQRVQISENYGAKCGRLGEMVERSWWSGRGGACGKTQWYCGFAPLGNFCVWLGFTWEFLCLLGFRFPLNINGIETHSQ